MPRPLQRGVSGEHQRRWSVISHDSYDSDDSQMKSKTVNENGLATELYGSSADPRKCHKILMILLKTFLLLVVVLALTVSFWWRMSITVSSKGHIIHSTYRRLHELLISDLVTIGDLYQGQVEMTELPFCFEEYENFVPCYNVSRNKASKRNKDDVYDIDRRCERSSRQTCLILPPLNYRIPLRWPTGRDVIWVANVKISAQEVLSSGSLTKRMMMLDDEQISFHSDSLTSDSIEDYSHQLAEMIGLTSSSNFVQAGVRIVLDIGCGYGTFAAHLLSKHLLTMCVAPYEVSGSQVQLTLERGLPTLITSFPTKQLPFPSLSYDMIHCARCGVDWDLKDGLYLVEVDRVLRPGGYFVWTSPITNARNKMNQKRWNVVRSFVENLCWELLSQQDETVVWKKTTKRGCYFSRKLGTNIPVVCSKGLDIESPYYRAFQACIGGTHNRRWKPVEEMSTWPSRLKMNLKELQPYGLQGDDLVEDNTFWNSAVRDYWSLLSPLIFSDHPKRPGDEDPSPPFNMRRNVLDMNSRFGGFNAALLETGKSVWVMNVVPTNGANSLPLILDRGFVGVLHDWCEAFPTYPRTYDMVHADGLLSLENGPLRRCSTFDILVEIDRVLRPEGWVIFRDTGSVNESARPIIARLRWESRVIDLERNNDEKLLICQKPFFKKHKTTTTATKP